MIFSGWRLVISLSVVGTLAVCCSTWALEEDEYGEQRAQMIRVIENTAQAISFKFGYKGPNRGDQDLDRRVLEVMAHTPRHLFVPEAERDKAYADRPLRIGYGQTISQPFMVALMTHLLATEPDHVVLEVGTGSGYQAAILAPLVRRVCTIEIIPELGMSAAQRLERLDYANILTRIGDGYYGWEECGPFDGIVVTAAADHIPPPLLEQLKPEGRMVIPVRGPFIFQHLVLATKSTEGRVYTRQLLPVAFVPLLREDE